jgi:hypothetical protein
MCPERGRAAHCRRCTLRGHSQAGPGSRCNGPSRRPATTADREVPRGVLPTSADHLRPRLRPWVVRWMRMPHIPPPAWHINVWICHSAGRSRLAYSLLVKPAQGSTSNVSKHSSRWPAATACKGCSKIFTANVDLSHLCMRPGLVDTSRRTSSHLPASICHSTATAWAPRPGASARKCACIAANGSPPESRHTQSDVPGRTLIPSVAVKRKLAAASGPLSAAHRRSGACKRPPLAGS